MKMMIRMLGLLGLLSPLAFAISATGCGGGYGDAETGEKSDAGPPVTAPVEGTSAAPPVEATSPPPPAAVSAPTAAEAEAEADTVTDPAEDPAKPEQPGSGSTADELMEGYLSSLGEIAAAFRSVTDEESAKAAGQTIRDIVSGMQSLAEEWKTIPKAELAATSAGHAREKRDAENELTQALLPVMMNQTHAQHVKDAMKGLPTFPSGR